MSAEQLSKVKWTPTADTDVPGTVAIEPCGRESLAAIQHGFDDDTTVLAGWRIRLFDRSTDRAHDRHWVTLLVCGADHHVHWLIGVEDETTHTSHLVHDMTTTTTC